MRKESLLIVLLIIHSLITVAQSNYLSGRVVDENGKSMQGANVILLNGTQTFKESLTDSSGKFEFKDLPKGFYTLSINSLGYETYQTQVNSLMQLPDIKLKVAVNNLKDVAVTYKKPPVDFQAGKTVVNVDAMIGAAGGTAFEVLQKSPGVNVDENGAVRMSGKQGVMVMIDGKLQPVSGDDLAMLLKSIPANMIDKIELNTNPSSKYDAGGNAGIIDIRTKKEKRDGINGTLSGSLIQARYTKGTAGMNFNFRNNKLNFSTSYNYTNRKDFNQLEMYRRFLTNGILDTRVDQTNFFKIPVQIHNAQLGVDYSLSKNTTVGVSGSFFTNDNVRLLDNNSVLFNSANVLTGFSLTNAESDYHRKNPATTLSLRQKTKNDGLISLDLDYAYYGTQNNQNNFTSYLNPDQTEAKNPYILFGDLTGEVSIRTAKADYVQPLKGWFNKLETGFKSSWVLSDNDVAFFDRSNNGNVPLNSISNHFIYNENINAGYVSFHKTTEKLTTNFGMRLEHTETSGKQIINNVNTKRSYIQLFPNLSLSYKLNTLNTIGLSISRRVDRPNYKQLNPFRYYINENTYTVGNTDLKPQITKAFEFNHTIGDKYNIKYSYSQTKDNILEVLSPDPSLPNVVQQTDKNLAVLNFYSIDFSTPFQISSRVKNYTNILLTYGQFKGNLVNTDINTGLVSFQLNSTNTFNITSTLTAELSCNYLSRERSGFLTSRSNGTIGIGVQKQLLNKMATIKLNVSDVFLTGTIIANTSTKGYSEDYRQTYDSRQATLSFSYRFGKGAQQIKKKVSGAEDERRRAG
jgi:hypothetical protein